MIDYIKRAKHRLSLQRMPREEREQILEDLRLQRLPSQMATETTLLKKRIRLLDAMAYLVSRQELFHDRKFDFSCDREHPLILDCGANIGLASIWFKTRYPQARITAFEPSPQVLPVLRHNLAVFELDDVTLVEAAAWTKSGEMTFAIGESDTGKLDNKPNAQSATVKSVRLRDYLCEPIDFLKIDIEGVEVDVLADCAGALDMVQRLSVEYHAPAEQPQQLDRLLALLRESGFRLYLDTVYAPEQPFHKITTQCGFDLQIDISAVRPA